MLHGQFLAVAWPAAAAAAPAAAICAKGCYQLHQPLQYIVFEHVVLELLHRLCFAGNFTAGGLC
jgi:hypothetical protein